MAPRVNLQALLETLLGSENVYFQPPPTVSMVYPCIVFGLDTAKTQFADNLPYCYDKQYSVTVIDADPDSLIPDKVAMLSKCSFERHFTSDNLNHNLFRLFY